MPPRFSRTTLSVEERAATGVSLAVLVFTMPPPRLLVTMTVADAAQRSGMSEADLRAINNVPPRMLIKSGSTLIVPRGARVQEDVQATVADTGHLSFQPEIVTRRTVVKAGRNDNVASIANRYRLNPASVADWNDVKTSHVFKRGFDVVVFLPVRASKGAGVGSGIFHRAPVLKSSAVPPRGGTPSKKKR